MTQTEKIRDRVQEAYAEAVTTQSGCCTTSCCGGDVEQKGVAAKLAGKATRIATNIQPNSSSGDITTPPGTGQRLV